MKTIYFVFAIVVCSSASYGGEVQGQALDLQGLPIPNLTVQIFSSQARIAARFFENGVYSVPIENSAVPEFGQGVTVIFSAPGRDTVQVNLHGRSVNSFNVVLPERTYGDPPPTIYCIPQYYYCRPQYRYYWHSCGCGW